MNRRGKSISSVAGEFEEEFGVPFPGAILPPEQWTKTALKQLPLQAPIRWEDVFGRRAPVVLDLGCGNGRFLIGSAIERPHWDHLGIDLLPVVIRYAVRRANQRGLRNIRFAVGDARELVTRLLAPASVREVHMYHPQPYYNVIEIHRRLITPQFLARVWQVLEPDGLLVVQTDNPAYWRYLQAVVPYFFIWEEHPEPWPDAPRGRTRREIIALQRGLPVFRAQARPRAELDEAEALQLASALPSPLFDADRRLQELDRLA